MEMQWDKLLTSKRLGINDDSGDGIRTEYYRDYDRIVFSASFRRLARKTQVHPLSFNDHIHNRLTHSIEVSSVGRSLGLAVGLKIKEKLPDYVEAVHFASIVQAACVAHDIGNPPFGHAGEYAIRQWFTENEDLIDKYLTKKEQSDLKSFEGNAQGFRIVSQLENHYQNGGLRLTFATLGALIKYPWQSNHSLASEKNKFNIFQSEIAIFEEVIESLGLIPLGDGQYARHPLAYLMEAADDICYKILDIEDALELNLLKISDVIPIFERLANNSNIQDIGEEYSVGRRIIDFRAKAIHNLIQEVVEVFDNHYTDIMNGSFEGDLISKISVDSKNAIKDIKDMTQENVFSNRRKVELEVGAYTSIEIILKAFISAVNDSIEKGDKLSFKSKRILELMESNLLEKCASPYEKYMAITDFVSGMTDNYATFLAKQISGSAK